MSFREIYINSVTVRKNISVERDPGFLIPNLYFYDGLPVSEAEQSAFLHLLAAGNLFCENLFSFSYTPMNCYMLLFTQEGSGTLSYSGTSVSLTKKHLLFFDCSRHFSLQSTLLPWSFKIFFLAGERLELFSKLLHAKNAPCFLLSDFSPLHKCFHQLIGLGPVLTMPQFLLMQQLLNQICTALYLAGHPALSASSTETAPALTDLPSYLIEMKDTFDHHYQEEFSLSASQERFSVNKYRLCREFAEVYGEPPLHYLNRRRMEAAKEMLLTTDLSIHVISSLVGFENVSHFINLFKKYAGTTPKAFRQKAPEVLPVSHSPAQ